MVKLTDKIEEIKKLIANKKALKNLKSQWEEKMSPGRMDKGQFKWGSHDDRWDVFTTKIRLTSYYGAYRNSSCSRFTNGLEMTNNQMYRYANRFMEEHHDMFVDKVCEYMEEDIQKAIEPARKDLQACNEMLESLGVLNESE